MELAKLKDTAELFKRVRDENDLSKAELAKRIKSSGPYVSSIESKKKVPGEKLLTRLAEEFSIDLNECLALIKPSKESIGMKNSKRGRKKKLEETGSKKVIELHKEKEEVVLSKIKNAATLFRTVRKANNLTLNKMRDKISSPASYLSSIENGNKIPGKRLVTKLAETFKLPLDQCLKIAGFSSDAANKGEKQQKVNEVKVALNNETDLLTDSKVLVVNETKTDVKEITLKETLVEDTQKEKKINGSKQPSRKKDDSAIEAVNLTDLNYSKVAKGEFDLSSGKSFVADLNLLMNNTDGELNSYEFTFIVDVETEQAVQVKISQGIVTVETGKKKQWILQ
ncbi:helix-turn-helix transcriptional regulator [Priestia sp. SB1]|uniref:helix-turn-helix domain-containing protein n=1 Tax=Priestia sp. SB1 TaxID=3132359 RepID=UPI00317B6665